MSRTKKALLRHGQWLDAPTRTKEPVELTASARAQGMRAFEALARLDVTTTLDDPDERAFVRVSCSCQHKRGASSRN